MITSGTARKTLVQVAAGAQDKATVVAFSFSFDGTSATATPVLVELARQTTAGTGGVSGTIKKANEDAGNSASTLLTGPTGAVWTAEPTTTDVLWHGRFTPVGFGGYFEFPPSREYRTDLSGRLALLVTAAAAVGVAGEIRWED
jgi:hypothetical protein